MRQGESAGGRSWPRSLSARLVAALAAIAVLVAVPALYGVSRLDALRELAVELRERQGSATAAANRASAGLGEAEELLRSHVATEDGAAAAAADSALAGARAALDSLRTLGYAAEVDSAAALAGVLAGRAETVRQQVAAGRLDAATETFSTYADVTALARRALGPVDAAIRSRSAAAVRRAETISASATGNVFVGLTAALLLAGLIGVWITRSVAGPLDRLRAGMATVTEGRFETPSELPYGRDDEIGDLARSFRTMTQRLGELSELKAEFMGAVTHRLKTPVSVIRGYVELLADGEFGTLTSDQRETLSEIREQTGEMIERVDHLIGLVRLEAGRLTVEPEVVPLDDLLHELRETFSPLADQRRIDFSVEAGPGAPAELNVDHDRLRDDVLGNLLSNAFKFTRDGGRVTLRASGGGGRGARFRVRDDGDGIPEDDIGHVFEPYYRSGGNGTEGTGLGLSIAREVVELHGGDISVESTSGRGATFTVTLPPASPS